MHFRPNRSAGEKYGDARECEDASKSLCGNYSTAKFRWPSATALASRAPRSSLENPNVQ